MPVVDSRLGPGTLVLGTLTSIECQMANVRLEPSADETDGTPTLCEPAPAPQLSTSWVLAGTAIQDFDQLSFGAPATILTNDTYGNAIPVKLGAHFAGRKVDVIAAQPCDERVPLRVGHDMDRTDVNGIADP